MFKKKLRPFVNKNNSEQEPWFEALHIEADGTILRVTFPHNFFGKWFFSNKQQQFEQAVRACFLEQISEIHYRYIPHNGIASQHTIRKDLPAETPNRSQTLESYCFNEKNAFALNIIEQLCAKEPGTLYSPLLLCGASGTGKTHLLLAIAEKFTRKQFRNYFVFHPNEITQTEIFYQPQKFWQQYSALFIDDIQDVQSLPEVQNILIHCFDACDHRQIVLTSTLPLCSLKLDSRLLSRLTAGLTVKLEEPDLEVRLQYLQKLCSEKNLSLTKKNMLQLAQHCSQYRQLQGTLLRISAHAHVKKRAITQDDIEAILDATAQTKELSSKDILNLVSKLMDVSIEDILGTHRQNKLVLARQLAMYVCRTSLGLSYPELGRVFGGKDHSTVIHSIKKIEKLLLTNTDVNNLLTQLKESL